MQTDNDEQRKTIINKGKPWRLVDF